MTTSSNGESFAERYSAFHQIEPEKFNAHLLRYSLHAPLRWFWPLIQGLFISSFEEDRLCIDTIGRLHRLRDAKTDLSDFSNHLTNREFHRRVLHLRISTRRLEHALKALPRDR